MNTMQDEVVNGSIHIGYKCPLPPSQLPSTQFGLIPRRWRRGLWALRPVGGATGHQAGRGLGKGQARVD